MDPRIVRTRRRLQEALFELAHEQGIESVSVSDVADRAGVNRSTFYQHYADLETVLADALDRVAAAEGVRIEALDMTSREPPAAVVAFMQHIDDHAAIYRQVFVGGVAGAVTARLRLRVRELILADLGRRATGKETLLPVDVIAAGVSGSFAGVIGAWLEMDERVAPEVAAAWVWAMVLGPQRLDQSA